jgi:hypothetical protein
MLRRWLRAARMMILLLATASIAACEVQFTPQVTQVVWPTYPVGWGVGEIGSTPFPNPTPTSPFLEPGESVVVFLGADSLDCTQPIRGDNHYGYCLIPGTNEIYAWGECGGDCPDGPYPGIEVLRVPFADSAVYMAVVDGRDAAMEARQEGNFRGGILGGLGVSLGIPGIIEVCGATGPWGCALAVGIVLVDGVLAWDQFSDGRSAEAELNEPRRGYEFSVEDQFRLLREGREPESDLVP